MGSTVHELQLELPCVTKHRQYTSRSLLQCLPCRDAQPVTRIANDWHGSICNMLDCFIQLKLPGTSVRLQKPQVPLLCFDRLVSCLFLLLCHAGAKLAV